MNKRLLIVFLLGFSSGLPLSLVTSTLQAWSSESGSSLMAVGMLSLLGLPYIYRVFWGPLLDRYTFFSLGKRRSWMLSAQIILCLGFNSMAWLSPLTSPLWMSSIAFLMACSSATQDMAIEAHRVEYLPLKEHALGASIAVLGYRLALFLSGGLALILAHHIGWALTYRFMGFFMVIGIWATLWSPEPSAPMLVRQNLAQFFTAPVKELMARPEVVSIVLFILFYKLGEAFTATTSGIVMPFLIQGLGFSLDTIGYVNKIMGISAILLGGIIAGFLMLRWSLYRALFFFGILQATTNVLFVMLAILGKNLLMLTLAVVFDNLAAGMGTTALVAFFMRTVDQRFTATQFSILVAISTIPRVFSGPIAVLVQSWLGWVGLYQLSVVLALGFIPFLMILNRHGTSLAMTPRSVSEPPE